MNNVKCSLNSILFSSTYSKTLFLGVSWNSTFHPRNKKPKKPKLSFDALIGDGIVHTVNEKPPEKEFNYVKKIPRAEKNKSKIQPSVSYNSTFHPRNKKPKKEPLTLEGLLKGGLLHSADAEAPEKEFNYVKKIPRAEQNKSKIQPSVSYNSTFHPKNKKPKKEPLTLEGLLKGGLLVSAGSVEPKQTPMFNPPVKKLSPLQVKEKNSLTMPQTTKYKIKFDKFFEKWNETITDINDENSEPNLHINDINNLPENIGNMDESNHWQNKFFWDKCIKDANLKLFNQKEFRPYQREAINAILSTKSVFLGLPTGGGKTLTFLIPVVLSQDKVTIVVSPLLALIEDQLQKLKKLGIPAAPITGSMSKRESKKILEKFSDVSNFPYKILYITPELLGKRTKLMNGITELNKKNKLARIIIDEAHCVVEWGLDFRPEFKKLSIFKEKFPKLPIVCLTATAHQDMKIEILKNLKIEDSVIFQSSFNRPNLEYIIKQKKEELIIDEIYEFLNENQYFEKCGVIYCLTTKDCENLSKELNLRGLSTTFYHANLDLAKRLVIQRDWMNNQFNIVCATIAFGLGIDKSNIRFIIHHTIPPSLESYYQQTGRAGRDGKHSKCLLFYQESDVNRFKNITRSGNEDKTLDQKVIAIRDEKLDDIMLFCNNLKDCKRGLLLKHFGEDKKCLENCNLESQCKYHK